MAFTSVGLPARDEVVHLLLNAGWETPTFAFACHKPGLGWVDAETCLPIPEAVHGWRPHPFFPGRRRTVKHRGTTIDVPRELARLFSKEGRDQATAIHRAVDPPRRAEWSLDNEGDRHREGGSD